jgi:hypothetical protein
MRVVGAAAIALAASLVIENAVVLAGAPSYHHRGADRHLRPDAATAPRPRSLLG